MDSTGFLVGSVLLEKACVGAVVRFFFAASRYVSSGRGVFVGGVRSEALFSLSVGLFRGRYVVVCF